MPALKEKIESARNVVIESNSVLKFLRPDLYLTVLDPAIADFKKSAQDFLHQANAIILHDSSGDSSPKWHGALLRSVPDRPIFRITAPSYVNPEITNFVRRHL